MPRFADLRLRLRRLLIMRSLRVWMKELLVRAWKRLDFGVGFGVGVGREVLIPTLSYDLFKVILMVLGL